ncbi:MAG: MBL fold metallo-hydrolase [Planctomycetota bacterium]
MKLSMRGIKNHNVPKGSISLWWLGQGSFIVKSSKGIIVAIDPYLSNSCKAAGESVGLNCDRLIEPPLSPQDLVGIDLYVVTHSHQDHLDPETVGPYRRAGGKGPYIAPPESVEKLKEMGVNQSEMCMIWPNKTHIVGDFRIRATFAIPYGADDLTHVGYLIFADHGPTFYFTGDTDYHEILANSVAEFKPDVLLTVINGAFKNMGPAQAALLARQINPRIVIPYHYDLFPDNQMIPHMLRTNLHTFGMQERFRILKHGEVFTFPE